MDNRFFSIISMDNMGVNLNFERLCRSIVLRLLRTWVVAVCMVEVLVFDIGVVVVFEGSVSQH